jgi:hypothetical protein
MKFYVYLILLPKHKEKTMVNRRNLLGMLVLILVFGMMVAGCASLFGTGQPSTFRSGSAGDTTILLREGLNFDQAFREVIFILNRHGFEPEMIQHEAGFVRTRWNYSWVTGSGERYRVRVTISFNPSRTQLILGAPSEWSLDGGRWVTGYDTRAIETLRNDITQIIGN